MIQISKPEDWAIKLYPENAENAEMVLSHYAIVAEYKDGYVLHHTITWSMFYLTKEEFDDILNNEEMKKFRIVLDKDIDEDTIAEQSFLKRAEWPYKFEYKRANSFVIMTTTACNARCPYCYEKGIKALRMSKKVAENTVQFIKRLHTGTVHIRWFGGEPLLNADIIDYIVTRLKEEGIEMDNTMISNSSLLEDYADKIDSWKIKNIQVTLDGIGEEYDRIKGYVGTSGSTFEKVMRGIDAAVEKSKTHLSIRLNISFDNVGKLEDTLNYLRNRFSEARKTGRVSVYIGKLFDIICEDSGEEYYRLSKLIAEVAERNKDIISYEKNRYPSLTKKDNISVCSSSRGGGICINPFGKFTPCEHWHDEDIMGDVVSGFTETEKAEKWRIKSGENIAFCKEHRCPLMPTCARYRMCDATPYCKNEHRMEVQLREKKESIKATYDYYLERVEELKKQKAAE